MEVPSKDVVVLSRSYSRHPSSEASSGVTPRHPTGRRKLRAVRSAPVGSSEASFTEGQYDRFARSRPNCRIVRRTSEELT